MAYNSSGSLTPAQTYQLGEYLFRLIVQYISSENITTVQCNATHGTEHAQTGIDLAGTMSISKWRVEASDKSADVYATTHADPLDTSPVLKPVTCAASGHCKDNSGSQTTFTPSTGVGMMTFVKYSNYNGYETIIASPTAGTRYVSYNPDRLPAYIYYDLTQSYTYYGKTVYYYSVHSLDYAESMRKFVPVVNNGISVTYGSINRAKIAWCMIYGDPKDEEYLVSRFAIDVADAGGGSWDEPASTGDPSYTLEVTVNGALSGRHNDPLNDTSYHYVPAEQDAATVYGSGGDGGHGGGGGAGASTVVIHSIATERAGNVEETAIAKRHGYGSGGGKGGTGAGGCILVYY